MSLMSCSFIYFDDIGVLSKLYSSTYDNIKQSFKHKSQVKAECWAYAADLEEQMENFEYSQVSTIHFLEPQVFFQFGFEQRYELLQLNNSSY